MYDRARKPRNMENYENAPVNIIADPHPHSTDAQFPALRSSTASSPLPAACFSSGPRTSLSAQLPSSSGRSTGRAAPPSDWPCQLPPRAGLACPGRRWARDPAAWTRHRARAVTGRQLRPPCPPPGVGSCPAAALAHHAPAVDGRAACRT